MAYGGGGGLGSPFMLQSDQASCEEAYTSVLLVSCIAMLQLDDHAIV